jgi:hypothetical protein
MHSPILVVYFYHLLLWMAILLTLDQTWTRAGSHETFVSYLLYFANTVMS